MTRPKGSLETTVVSGPRVSSSDLRSRERAGVLPVPFAEVGDREGIALGFRQGMLELTAGDGTGGGVTSGGGMGSDFIVLDWNGRMAYVRGIDLLRAWVASFDPEEAARFPEGLGA